MLTYDDTAIARDLPDLVDMMHATGLRIGETDAIKWSSIDLTNGFIDVGTGIVVRARGSGLHIRESDSSKLTARTLSLPKWCVALLSRRQSVASGDLVFPAPKGGLRDPSNTSADLKDAFTAAGYRWMTSHAIRRSVATLIDGAGIAADQLGHSKPSMTQDRYMNRDLVVTAGTAVLEALAETPEGLQTNGAQLFGSLLMLNPAFYWVSDIDTRSIPNRHAIYEPAAASRNRVADWRDIPPSRPATRR